jgi:hypothetical protein
MKNYLNSFSNFLKNNGIINSRTFFLSTYNKSNKEIKTLKETLGKVMSHTNPSGKNLILTSF